MTSWPDGAAEFRFVGNATLLIRYGTLTLLTDPNFLHRGQYAYLGKGLMSRRLTEPAQAVDDIPSDLDAVVLSHLHGGHWDRVARRRLDRSLPIITTPHGSRRLQGVHGFSRATGLPTRCPVGTPRPLAQAAATGHGKSAGLRRSRTAPTAAGAHHR